MEFMGTSHDKLGNGFAAYLYLNKRIVGQNQERIRKELDKRAFQTFSRKLFSIYRYKTANLRKPKILVNSA